MKNAPELQSTRGRVFFWIGLTILPVFWVWWMRPAYFTIRQRQMAWIWTVLYLAGLFASRSTVFAFLPELVMGYPVIALRLALALFVWLIVRIEGFWRALIGLIVACDCIAIMAGALVPTLAMIGTHPIVFVPAIVLGIAHLLLDPIRSRYRQFRRGLRVGTDEP